MAPLWHTAAGVDEEPIFQIAALDPVVECGCHQPALQFVERVLPIPDPNSGDLVGSDAQQWAACDDGYGFGDDQGALADPSR